MSEHIPERRMQTERRKLADRRAIKYAADPYSLLSRVMKILVERDEPQPDVGIWVSEGQLERLKELLDSYWINPEV